MYANDYIVKNLENINSLSIRRDEDDSSKIKFTVSVDVEGVIAGFSLSIGGIEKDADIYKLLPVMLEQGIKTWENGLQSGLESMFGERARGEKED